MVRVTCQSPETGLQVSSAKWHQLCTVSNWAYLHWMPCCWQLLGTSFLVHLSSHSVNDIPLQPLHWASTAVYNDVLLSQIVLSPIFWYDCAKNIWDFKNNVVTIYYLWFIVNFRLWFEQINSLKRVLEWAQIQNRKFQWVCQSVRLIEVSVL